MQKKKKKIKALYLAIAIVALLLIAIPAYADTLPPGPDPSDPNYINYKGLSVLFMDENGDFVFQTLDKKRTSRVFYRTIGFELSRIRRGVTNPVTDSGDPYIYNRNNRQSIILPLDDTNVKPSSYSYMASDGTPMMITQRKFPKEYVMGQIQTQNAAWYTEIEEMLEKNETVHIGCDAILIKCYDTGTLNANGTPKIIESGGWAFGQLTGEYYTYKNWRDICKKYGFRQSSIATHYDQFFVLNQGGTTTPEIPEIPEAPETPDSNSYKFVKQQAANVPESERSPYQQNGENPNLPKSNVPQSYTAPVTSVYNTDESGTYDIGKAIPASATYQNDVAASRWYGYFTINKNSIAEEDLKKAFIYSIDYWYPVTRNFDGYYEDGIKLEDFHATDTWYDVSGTYTTTSSSSSQQRYDGPASGASGLSNFVHTGTYYRDGVMYWTGTYTATSTSTETHSWSGKDRDAPANFTASWRSKQRAVGTYTDYEKGTLSGTAEYRITADDNNGYNYYTVENLGLYELESIRNYALGSTTNCILHDITYTGEVAQNIPFSIKKNGVSWDQNSTKIGADTAYTQSNTTVTVGGTQYLVKNAYKGHVYLPVCDESRYAPATIYKDEAAAREARDAEIQRRTLKLIVYNDEFTLNGTNYLNGSGFASWMDEDVLNQAATNAGYEIEKSQKNTDVVEQKQTLKVGITTPNDDYYETLESTYKSFVYRMGVHTGDTDASSGEKKTFRLIDNPGSIPAIRAGYEQNEPVKVFSPVIAPIHIDDTYSTKQQAVTVGSGPTLNPDMSYKVVFDWDNYFELKYGKGYTLADKAGWLKFVQKKEVAFPFTVKYRGTIYEPSNTTGYTAFIELTEEDWDSFDIYLPSWAKEGVYQGDKGIQVRVYANNYVEDMNDEPFEKVNTDGSDPYEPLNRQYYVATYSYPVRIVGVMYGFVVDDTSDQSGYGGSDEYYVGPSRLIERNEEKYVGAYNRFNVLSNDDSHKWLSTLYKCLNTNETTYKRYDVPWLNTLPLQTGKTTFNIWDGCLPLGYDISFQLKTLGSMGDSHSISGSDYSIYVKPTYRYVAKDGTVLQNTNIADRIRLFCVNGDNEMARFDDNSTNIDFEAEKIQIGEAYHNFSYDDNDLILNGSLREIANPYRIPWKETTEGYTPKWAYLSSNNMLYMPDEKELRINESAPCTTDTDTDNDTVKRYNAELDNLNAYQRDQFNRSMQTWYGQYNIPGSTKIMNVSAFRLYYKKQLSPTGDKWDLYKKIAEVEGISYDAGDMNDLNRKITTDILWDWALSEGVTGEEPYWLTEGYLVLNFEISLYKGEQKYMTYYNNYDMWAAEKGTWKSSGEDGLYHNQENHATTTTITDYAGNVTDIELYSGDVAVIDISRRISDRRKASVWLID